MKMSKRRPRHLRGRLSQPRLAPGVSRVALPSAVEARIMDEVEKMARAYGVSRSFVVAVALADQFGVPLKGAYRYDR